MELRYENKDGQKTISQKERQDCPRPLVLCSQLSITFIHWTAFAMQIVHSTCYQLNAAMQRPLYRIQTASPQNFCQALRDSFNNMHPSSTYSTFLVSLFNHSSARFFCSSSLPSKKPFVFSHTSVWYRFSHAISAGSSRETSINLRHLGTMVAYSKPSQALSPNLWFVSLGTQRMISA